MPVTFLPVVNIHPFYFYAFFITIEEPVRPAAVRVSEGSQRSLGGNPELRVKGTGEPTHWLWGSGEIGENEERIGDSKMYTLDIDFDVMQIDILWKEAEPSNSCSQLKYCSVIVHPVSRGETSYIKKDRKEEMRRWRYKIEEDHIDWPLCKQAIEGEKHDISRCSTIRVIMQLNSLNQHAFPLVCLYLQCTMWLVLIYFYRWSIIRWHPCTIPAT